MITIQQYMKKYKVKKRRIYHLIKNGKLNYARKPTVITIKKKLEVLYVEDKKIV